MCSFNGVSAAVACHDGWPWKPKEFVNCRRRPGDDHSVTIPNDGADRIMGFI
jgi:hypothetical protein